MTCLGIPTPSCLLVVRDLLSSSSLKGDVSSIVINDYDRAVYCMWDAVVNHAEDLCEFIDSAVLDVET